jgi:pyruvate,water dikinase
MEQHNEPMILSFTSQAIQLHNSGGKGLHLGEMVSRGFPVPPGFIVTSAAYDHYCRENHLREIIAGNLQKIKPNVPGDLEVASNNIRALFRKGMLDQNLKEEILAAHRNLQSPAVAVRSSATAEDLAELSFAGQQDTYLNITDVADLISHVVECWSSLWTARAIGYRLQNEVDQRDIALAVVVQQMVQSDVSGVLFTANPLTGSRMESVIDATFGLGEALVSGLVDPDHYVVNKQTMQVTQKQLGKKALSIRADNKGGVKSVVEEGEDRLALSESQVEELVKLGEKVQQVYGSPQDIEWAYSNGELFLLQSRAITSLFPLPDGMPAEPLLTLVSFAAIQGLVDPITPIGQSCLKELFAIGSDQFGVKVSEDTQKVLFTAGERLWANFTPIFRNTFGRKTIPYIFGMVEPTVKQALDQLLDDPRLQPEKKGLSPRALSQLVGFFLPVAARAFLNIASPTRRRKRIIDRGEAVLKIMDDEANAIQGDRYQKLDQQAELLQNVAGKYLGGAFKLFVSGVASGVASWNVLRMLTRQTQNEKSFNWNDSLLEVTRGMPFNPTTEMDLRLWEMAKLIQNDTDALQLTKSFSPAFMAKRYKDGNLPRIIRDEVHRFLDQYGGRGLCEIDLGRTRWAEDPTHVFEMLVNYVKIENENEAPDAVFARGKIQAEAAIRLLTEQVKNHRGGWFKANLVKFWAGRVRQLMGMRESPKFFAVRMMWIVHREIRKTGQNLSQLGNWIMKTISSILLSLR